MIEILIYTHTQIYFGDPGDRTHALIEGCNFLGRGITTEPNAQVTSFSRFLSNSDWWCWSKGSLKLVL